MPTKKRSSRLVNIRSSSPGPPRASPPPRQPCSMGWLEEQFEWVEILERLNFDDADVEEDEPGSMTIYVTEKTEPSNDGVSEKVQGAQ